MNTRMSRPIGETYSAFTAAKSLESRGEKPTVEKLKAVLNKYHEIGRKFELAFANAKG